MIKIYQNVFLINLLMLMLGILIINVNVLGDRIEFKNVDSYNKSVIDHSENLSKSRQKRFLIFNNGGLVKMVFGFMNLLDFHPKHPTGNIVCLYNFQAQYLFPPTYASLISSFVKSRNLEQRKKRGLETNGDSSREMFYEMLENMLTRKGKNGRECLLKSICDAAVAPVSHNGLFGEAIQTVLTPGTDENVPTIYKEARAAGLFGADCYQIYKGCPDGILDSISVFL